MKKIMMALMCLVSLIMASCTPNNPSVSNPLANTKWSGKALETELVATFTADECYIQASGYANGVAVGSYKTSNSDIFITITTTSGDFDGQLNKGDILIASLNTTAQTISLDITLYGQKTNVVLTKLGGSSSGNSGNSGNSGAVDVTAENAFGTWVCTYLEEHYMENGKMEYEVEDQIFYRMILNRDYTYQFYANSQTVTYSGQWTLNGKSATFTYSGSVGKATVEELTAKKLKLRIDGSSSSEYELYYFDRQQ